ASFRLWVMGHWYRSSVYRRPAGVSALASCCSTNLPHRPTMKPPSLTIGVEEEYQIIDPQTRELQSYITQLLEYDHRFLGQVKPELHQSIVEVWSTGCPAPHERGV